MEWKVSDDVRDFSWKDADGVWEGGRGDGWGGGLEVREGGMVGCRVGTAAEEWLWTKRTEREEKWWRTKGAEEGKGCGGCIAGGAGLWERLSEPPRGSEMWLEEVLGHTHWCLLLDWPPESYRCVFVCVCCLFRWQTGLVLYRAGVTQQTSNTASNTHRRLSAHIFLSSFRSFLPRLTSFSVLRR